MLTGDFATMNLPDLLQWAEAGGIKATITVNQGGVRTWLRVADRRVLQVCPPPGIAGATPGPGVPADLTAVERLLDLFMTAEGSFEVVTTGDHAGTGIPVDIAIRVLVMEGLRHLDEWPRLDKAYPVDTARLELTGNPIPSSLSPLQRELVQSAAFTPSLAEARFKLGLSRPALLRRVEELRLMGLVLVDGASPGDDPVGRLLSQASVLLRERQFDEANIVFGALLSADPTDARVRRLLQEAEREHVAALYQELDPLSIVKVQNGAALQQARLSSTDRDVAGRINGRWDVSSLVLASPFREVETLKCLRKLVRLDLVTLEHRSKPGPRK
ncbi:MAG: DUF4388 domain-containing protein [Myxococcota bacterium]